MSGAFHCQSRRRSLAIDARVLPIVGDHFERGTFPNELIPEIAKLGLLG